MSEEERPRRVFVGNLAWGTTDDSLREAFEEGDKGSVSEAKVIIDRYSGRSRGFGFVTFSSPEHCTRALESDQKIIDGRQVRIDVASSTRR